MHTFCKNISWGLAKIFQNFEMQNNICALKKKPECCLVVDYIYIIYSQREVRSVVHTTFVLPLNRISKDTKMCAQLIAREYNQ